MRFAVQVLYLDGNCATAERVLPEGWDPIGGDIEDGNSLRLLLSRQLTDDEERAVELAEREAASS